MNELKEEIDAIDFAPGDELTLTLSVGWRTFLGILLPMLPMIVLLAVPPSIIIALIPFDEIAANANMSQWKAFQMQMRIENLVTAPFSMIVYMTAIVASVRTMARNRLGVWADFSTAMRRLLPAIGTSLLVGLFVFAAILVFAVPLAVLAGVSKPLSAVFAVVAGGAALVLAVFFVVKLIFVSQSVVIGGLSGMAAIKDSMRLVKGNWWMTAAVIIVTGICGTLLQAPAFVSGLVEGWLSDTDNVAVMAAAGTVTNSLVFAASLFGTATVSVLYLLRRNRLIRSFAHARGAAPQEYAAQQGYAAPQDGGAEDGPEMPQ